MAIYHNSVSIIQRSAGKSSVAAAAYRSGQKLKDERTGLIHDYTRKSGVDHSVILTPVAADWITDRQQLWNQVEVTEKRGDSQLAREITLAIPIELNREDKIKLVCEYVQGNFVALGMVADVNFHGMDSDNPHAHIMVSLRDLKIDEQGVVSFGNKNREWNHKNLLVKNRSDWAKLANEYLVSAGFSNIQIDHRSNADRGIEALPQIHLGVHVAAMRRKGIVSERSNEYDRIDATNHGIREKLEQIYESESATRDLEQQLVNFDRRVSNRNQSYEKIEIPKLVTKPSEPERIKWSLKKNFDPQLVNFILETADRLGTDCYTAGNYQVQISEEQIEVKYNNNVAMIVYPNICEALPIDYSFTVQQYQLGLRKSLNVLVASLEQQREQAQAKEWEQQRQTELQQLEQLEQRQPELELSRDIIVIDDSEIINDSKIIDNSELIIDDSQIIIDDSEIIIDDHKPLLNKNLSRKRLNALE